MDYDTTKLDEVVLLLLHFNAHTASMASREPGREGFISNPKSKAASVVLTEEGARRAEESFRRRLAKAVQRAAAAARAHGPRRRVVPELQRQIDS